MNDHEAVQMMQLCANEIRMLRGQIAALEPKAQAWDRLGKVLHLLPEAPRGEAPDLVWHLDRRAAELAAELGQPTPGEDPQAPIAAEPDAPIAAEPAPIPAEEG